MAASYQLLILAVVVCLVQRGECQKVAADITLDPESLRLVSNITTSKTSTGVVTIRCSRDTSVGKDNLRGLSIFRKLDSDPLADPPKVIVAAATGENNGLAKFVNMVNSANMGGSISQNEIFLNLTEVGCGDEGNYSCDATVYDQTFYTDRKTKSFTVEVTPGPIVIGADGQLVLNEILKIHCNGPLGSVEPNEEIKYSWEYRDYNEFSTEYAEWKPYVNPDNDGNQTDIKDDPDIDVGCFHIQASSLRRVLSLKDSKRQYRCYIRRAGISYIQYAGIYTMGEITDPGASTTRAPPGDSEQNLPKKSDVGMIVGVTIAVLVVVVVVVIIFVVIIRRRKANKEETYEAGDSASKPTPTAPSHTVDPAVSYSHPNRFRGDREPRGVSNEGMDYASDKPAPYDPKPQPPRYANDFHQGRRNQAYNDYDNDLRRGRRQNSDNDGTDSRLNSSNMSLGDGDPTLGTAI